MEKKWIVCDQDCPPENKEDYQFEVSICIKDTHGTRSFGWAGTDKIIILEEPNCEDCCKAYKEAMNKATVIANALNDKEI